MYKQKLKVQNYFDAAYLNGYITGLYFLSCKSEERNKDDIPLFLSFESDDDIFTIDEFKEKVRNEINLKTKSYLQAKQIAENLATANLEIHHPAWI